jgi:hypothetical protein
MTVTGLLALRNMLFRFGTKRLIANKVAYSAPMEPQMLTDAKRF